MDTNLAALDQVTSTAIDFGMRFGPKLLVAIIIMTAGYFAARWTAGVVGRSLRKFEFEPPVRQLMLNVIRALVMVLFGIMALQNPGRRAAPARRGYRGGRRGDRPRHAGSALQPRRWIDDNLYPAFPCRGVHLDRQGRGRGR